MVASQAHCIVPDGNCRAKQAFLTRVRGLSGDMVAIIDGDGLFPL